MGGKCTSPAIDAHNQANSTNENTTKEAEEMREHNINLRSRPYHSPQIEDKLIDLKEWKLTGSLGMSFS